MAEKPILLNTEMVRATLAGCDQINDNTFFEIVGTDWLDYSPFGKPGDVLWVRETFCDMRNIKSWHADFEYAADCPHDFSGCWTPSIHMPKDACRLRLRVKRVWIELLQDISCAGIHAEGVQPVLEAGTEVDIDGGLWPAGVRRVRGEWKKLWNSIYGTWDANPFVWCCEFEVM